MLLSHPRRWALRFMQVRRRSVHQWQRSTQPRNTDRQTDGETAFQLYIVDNQLGMLVTDCSIRMYHR